MVLLFKQYISTWRLYFQGTVVHLGEFRAIKIFADTSLSVCEAYIGDKVLYGPFNSNQLPVSVHPAPYNRVRRINTNLKPGW